MRQSPQTTRQAPSRTLLILGFGTLAFVLAQTTLIPALGDLQRELGASPSGIAWIITAYLLVASIATPIFGRLGDMFGKQRPIWLKLRGVEHVAVADVIPGHGFRRSRGWRARASSQRIARSWDLDLADPARFRSIGHVEGQERERRLFGCGFDGPPDCMAAQDARGERRLVAERAVVASEGCEDGPRPATPRRPMASQVRATSPCSATTTPAMLCGGS
jgi:hypothetical protein